VKRHVHLAKLPTGLCMAAHLGCGSVPLSRGSRGCCCPPCRDPLPQLLTAGKPICAATIRVGLGYLEVPFFATAETKRNRGYGRALLEAIEDVARWGMPFMISSSDCIFLSSDGKPRLRARAAGGSRRRRQVGLPFMQRPFLVGSEADRTPAAAVKHRCSHSDRVVYECPCIKERLRLPAEGRAARAVSASVY
jgi:GNAT superfamily N-acetyltransferase